MERTAARPTAARPPAPTSARSYIRSPRNPAAGADCFLLESIFRTEVWDHMQLPISEDNERACYQVGCCLGCIPVLRLVDGVTGCIRQRGQRAHLLPGVGRAAPEVPSATACEMLRADTAATCWQCPARASVVAAGQAEACPAAQSSSTLPLQTTPARHPCPPRSN